MNKSIIIGGALITGMTLAVASTFAATSTTTGTTSTTSSLKSFVQSMGEGGHGGHGMGGPMMSEMTDAEKTAFEAMSDTEKKTYMETKRTETKAKRDAQESVIDKLLAGTALTSSEETLRQTIITERAERKIKQAEMEANRTKI